ncbi:transglutaminase-like domain-containing protein [Mycoplasma crocodyli]|uniref:Putative lipoprotein n=1 Tax=Mycoplasma crocodyli (strain ATCC 51981 / MP145) TaxID=512564 RepID=D5E6F9_MYCCM|nr:transglutaminase-like domain-containing protein [Mycoplasma crocodyli]ADE19571.1 putative lipoprotein [Mycoplasma crocodyli MP145]
MKKTTFKKYIKTSSILSMFSPLIFISSCTNDKNSNVLDSINVQYEKLEFDYKNKNETLVKDIELDNILIKNLDHNNFKITELKVILIDAKNRSVSISGKLWSKADNLINKKFSIKIDGFKQTNIPTSSTSEPLEQLQDQTNEEALKVTVDYLNKSLVRAENADISNLQFGNYNNEIYSITEPKILSYFQTTIAIQAKVVLNINNKIFSIITKEIDGFEKPKIDDQKPPTSPDELNETEKHLLENVMNEKNFIYSFEPKKPHHTSYIINNKEEFLGLIIELIKRGNEVDVNIEFKISDEDIAKTIIDFYTNHYIDYTYLYNSSSDNKICPNLFYDEINKKYVLRLKSNINILKNYTRHSIYDFITKGLDRLSPSMSDTEKAYELMRYVSDTTEYSEKYRGIYDNRMQNDIGICGDWSERYQLLLSAANIPSVPVVSDFHAWTKVLLDGKWYNADPTFLKPLSNKLKLSLNSSINNYSYVGSFLNTDDEFKTTNVETGETIYGHGALRNWKPVLWNHSGAANYIKAETKNTSYFSRMFSTSSTMFYNEEDRSWYFYGYNLKSETQPKTSMLYKLSDINGEPSLVTEFNSKVTELNYELSNISMLKWKNFLIFGKIENGSKSNPIAYDLTTKTFVEFYDQSSPFQSSHHPMYLSSDGILFSGNKNDGTAQDKNIKKIDLNKTVLAQSINVKAIVQNARTFIDTLSKLRLLNSFLQEGSDKFTITKTEKEELSTKIQSFKKIYSENINNTTFDWITKVDELKETIAKFELLFNKPFKKELSTKPFIHSDLNPVKYLTKEQRKYNQVFHIGASSFFGDNITNSQNLTYTWYVDGIPTETFKIADANFVIQAVKLKDNMKVFVVVSDSFNKTSQVKSSTLTIKFLDETSNNDLMPLSSTDFSVLSNIAPGQDSKKIDFKITTENFNSSKFDFSWKLVHNNKVIKSGSDLNITYNKTTLDDDDYGYYQVVYKLVNKDTKEELYWKSNTYFAYK